MIDEFEVIQSLNEQGVPLVTPMFNASSLTNYEVIRNELSNGKLAMTPVYIVNGDSMGEGSSVGTYICTGVNDDLAIETLINEFVLNGTGYTLELTIKGIMGVRANPPNNTQININKVNSRKCAVKLNFWNCYIPPIFTADITFIGIGAGNDVYIEGLSVDVTSYSLYVVGICTITDCTLTDALGVYTYLTGIVVARTTTFIGVNGVNNTGKFFIQGCTFNSASSITNSGFMVIDSCIISSNNGIGLICDKNSDTTLSNSYMYGNVGIRIESTFAKTLTVSNSKIVCTGGAISNTSANPLGNISIIGSTVKGNAYDIFNTAVTGTIGWNLMGNRFSKAGVMVDGIVDVASKTASQYIYMPLYANKFNQTISVSNDWI